jgi:hypothetical protein
MIQRELDVCTVADGTGRDDELVRVGQPLALAVTVAFPVGSCQ